MARIYLVFLNDKNTYIKERIKPFVNNKAVSQTPSQINKYYYGTFDKTFKDRYNNNTATFRNKSKQKNTELFKHI